MIDLAKVRNYYIACGYTDLRLGIDGLAAVVTQQYGSCLDEESLFLFCGRRTDRIKALYWCSNGYILLYKRLSNGKFQWPRGQKRNLDYWIPRAFGGSWKDFVLSRKQLSAKENRKIYSEQKVCISRKIYIFLYFILPLCYNKGSINPF